MTIHRAGPVLIDTKMTIHRAGPVYSLVQQEISLSGTFATGSENVLELSFLGTKMTWWNILSREQKCGGTFALNKNYMHAPDTETISDDKW